MCSCSIGALPDAHPLPVLALGRVKSEPPLAPYDETSEKSPTRGQMLVDTPGALAPPSTATAKPYRPGGRKMRTGPELSWPVVAPAGWRSCHTTDDDGGAGAPLPPAGAGGGDESKRWM